MITPNQNRFAPSVHPRNATFGLKPVTGETAGLAELRIKL